MPAIANGTTSQPANPHPIPPDPNLPPNKNNKNNNNNKSSSSTHKQQQQQQQQQTSLSGIDLNRIPQPSPKVISSSSHIDKHFLPRRFLGAIPEKIVNSDETIENRKKFHQLRKNAISHLPLLGHTHSEDSFSHFGNDNGNGNERDDVGLIREAAKRIKIRKRGKTDRVMDLDLDLDVGTPEERQGQGRGKIKGGIGKGKDSWIGESFDIGREFLGSVIHEHEDADEEIQPPSSSSIHQGDNQVVNEAKGKGGAGGGQSESVPSRPAVSTRTTQETFVTARTGFSSSRGEGASSSKSTLDLNDTSTSAEGYQLTPQASLNGLSSSPGTITITNIRDSTSSSTQPLVPPSIKHRSQDSSDTVKAIVTQNKSSNGLSTRLKSALRKSSSKPENELYSTQSAIYATSSNNQLSQQKQKQKQKDKQNKSKSVQFPIDPIQGPSSMKKVLGDDLNDHTTKGDKAPVDPAEVLERSGDEVAGTSHEAVEEALEEEEEDWEEVRKPGEVILRDRMLVRVGYHREDNVRGFDEASQRRNPCARLDPLEEFIVIYRKSQIELYSNYTYPFQEKVVGHKHLAFVIPLLPHRTSLSIFNSEDVTICLTTSINKLQDDVSNILRSSTTRAGAVKNRVKQSKQVQWLRGRRRGTQVFIMKLAERSRSLDWYWEIWRDLNGELPDRFDVSVPSLSTSIRLIIPQDEEYYMVGNSSQCAKFEKSKIIENCWEMLKESMDIEELRRQNDEDSENRSGKLNVQLAWKSSDGNLDWLTFDQTVQGKKRDWTLLAGLARSQGESKPRELQLRPAKHQPNSIKLEDGTLLEEPPGVEGYLTRHNDGTTKEQVYISSHDGNIFVGHMRDAKPPLLPQKESSTPSELFPDLFSTFIDTEHKRIARYLQRCAGCIDLRDIVSIKIISDDSPKHTRSTSSTSATREGFDRIVTNAEDVQGKTFEVEMSAGGIVKLECQTWEIAKEWVESLKALKSYWERRHRVDARQRMDAISLHSHENPFTGTELSNESDNFISEIWDWCVLDGCRSTCLSGRLYMKKDKWDKFRSKYIVLTGGSLVSFKIKKKSAFHTRSKRYSLFGAYVYSGMLALDEMPSSTSGSSTTNDAFSSQARVYQDGLQSSDGPEDTTFCVRLALPSSKWSKKSVNHPWEEEGEGEKDGLNNLVIPDLTKKATQLLIFRARSKLERDRWVWATNAEMERQVRSHQKQEDALRNHGNVPERWF
ncbi:uncharacterized protein IL334_004799 [Kwoniella shivajii]|uniref:PH domain-containing protein n=1 Tax=Kwoniella shivajii TaxID=564305 RepID=A0ABZ1D1D1_9TREE|nr:hypothetical protein IL334_004799 [Kwoniella shivajii]